MSEEEKDVSVQDNSEDVSIQVGTIIYKITSLKTKDDLLIKGKGFTVRLSEVDGKVNATIISSLRPPVTVMCR